MKVLNDFVRAREDIRLARLRGDPPPWTKDPILQKYRFCNVRRKHDRVSQWLLKHVLTEANLKADRKTFLQFTMLCRYINWPPTIQAILDRGYYIPEAERIYWADIRRLLDRRHAEGHKTWTGAYMVKCVHEVNKGVYVTGVVQKGFNSENYNELGGLIAEAMLEPIYDFLRTWYGVGPFMAGQIIADWTYTSLLSGAWDLNSWAPIGPGSRRGYNRLMGIKPLKRWPNKEEYLENLRCWREQIIKKLGDEFSDMTLHDLQNCLCELDKYLRVKNGEGKPRSMFRSETAY